MDPNETLLDWAYAVLSEDPDRANEAHESLLGWLANGGFEPDWGQTYRKVGLPSRKQFLSYDRRTGKIGG